MVSITEDGYNVHLQFTPDLANDWKNAMLASSELAVGNYHYLTRRVLDSMNASQLESKLWLVQTLEKFDVQPKRVALLAGWFAQYIVPLMFDTFPECEWIENFEIDPYRKNCLIEGLDEIGYSLKYEKDINMFEEKIKKERP